MQGALLSAASERDCHTSIVRNCVAPDIMRFSPAGEIRLVILS